jgi:hypothetical protein
MAAPGDTGGRELRPDELVARVAARQAGIIGIAQLLACGLSHRQVQHRERRGVLHRVHRGVYAVGVPPLGDEARWWAAVLAVGGVLCHRCQRGARAAAAAPRRAPLGRGPPRRPAGRAGVGAARRAGAGEVARA